MPTSGASQGFARVERMTVGAGAIEQIKRLIVTKHLRPGEKLPPERELTQVLGVSRATLREAIRALVSIGVLESKPGLGTYVTSLDSELLAAPLVFLFDASADLLLDLFDVRLMIEVGAAEQAARLIDAEALGRLKELLGELDAVEDDVAAFYEVDIEFHHVIHASTGNKLLAAVMDSLSVLGRAHRIAVMDTAPVRRRIVREHEKIYRALSRRSGSAARAAMAEHLTHVRRLFEAAAAEQGGG